LIRKTRLSEVHMHVTETGKNAIGILLKTGKNARHTRVVRRRIPCLKHPSVTSTKKAATAAR
ncbi:MAG: hypothetical protein IJ865_02790, partial [Clostridia bacterium]|nr:hypothetical protein [Clostridia bacterium]